MIVGSFLITFLSLIFAFPLSIGCAGFMITTESRFIKKFLSSFVFITLAIPPVIYGFVGLSVIVPIFREILKEGSGMCILTASFVLSLLVSPTMIIFFYDSFKSVPLRYLMAAESVGFNTMQKFIYLTLPYSKNGILKGSLLGFGRAVGDTLIALMLAGGSAQFPEKISDSVRTLTAHIALVKAASTDSFEFKSIYFSALILYFLTVAVVLTINLISQRKNDL